MKEGMMLMINITNLYVAKSLIERGYEVKKVTIKGTCLLFWFEKTNGIFDVINEIKSNLKR